MGAPVAGAGRGRAMTRSYGSVVYVALGPHRVRAAVAHTADLAAAGAKVTLVVADRPEWTDVRPAPGVRLQRLSAHPWRTVRALLSKGADLLLAGDPEAMPIADAARRRFPALEIRTEPVSDPDRRPAPADLAVVTPWYPSPNDPFAGAFVRAAVRCLGGQAGSVSILHTEHWFYPPWRLTGNLIDITMGRELTRAGGVTVADLPEGELTRVVTPQGRRSDYAAWADEQVHRLRAALPTGRIEAPVVHAHAGHFGGVAAAALARPDARLVVTEHATFLPKVFAQPAARRRYAGVLARADHVLCVSRHLRDEIAAEFPRYSHKLRVVPNPIDFDRFEVRPAPPERPARWLYAGRMLDHKGVLTLVDGFARIAAEDPGVTLTLVGSGPLEDAVRDRVREHGLAGRVVQRPPVPPDDMAALLHNHDLLVHASRVETFGMTLVEAVATGTPVLAARSDGPAETLDGLDGVAGALFPVTEDPAVLADAYRRLGGLWPRLDLPAARARLRARCGREAVGEQVLAAYREPAGAPEPAAVATEEPADRIAVVAVNPPGPARIREFLDTARQRGFGIDLIVQDPAEWAREAEAGARVHRIGPPPAARREARPVPPSGSPLPLALARTVRGKAASLHRKVFRRAYAAVRPHALWRSTRPVLPEIDMIRVRRVVVHGVPGETIGWHIARRYPDLPVSTALTLPEDYGS
ncbi:MAG TPA: glycosyltransferase family 4 protein [Actinoplanes sp.]|nr:glycosyltransferase family 4 protein [Actinoplanes sp.]